MRLPRRTLLATLLMAALMGATACNPSFTLERPAPEAILPAEVDSFVVRPFERARAVQMNDADLALLPKHLREALSAREGLRGYDRPPTLLPNTVVLEGRLERYAVNERRGEGLTLRTIDLDAELRVLNGQGEQTPRVVRQAVSWQKIYPGTPVSALELDLEDAVRELAGQFAQALAPLPRESIRLRSGSAGGAGFVGGHPALIKGNRYAVAQRFQQAKLSWLGVLFNPAPPAAREGYRLDAQTLNRLRAVGITDEVRGRLGPLVGESALPLVTFRQRLRVAAGETLPNEGLILTLADVRAGAAHANLMAAHANLAAVYEIEGREDVAAYHWAHAWAHNPTPELLERWHALQAGRKVLPRGLSEQQALELYLRIPPPGTARVVPGEFERSVLPPPAFPVADGDQVAAGAPATPAGAAGAAGTSGTSGTSGTNDSTPGGAAGSGPSGSEGPPAAATPTAGSAPAAR